MAVVTEQRRPRTAACLALAAALLAVGLGLLWFVHNGPKADPWADTKNTIAVACNVPVDTLRYAGGAYDRNEQGQEVGMPFAVKFTSPDHPVILVPWNDIVGFQGEVYEVKCHV